MNIGGRRVIIRRRWLLLVSLIWIASVYALWIFLETLQTNMLVGSAHCDLLLRSNWAEGYAECLHSVNATITRENAQTAASATLIAILPIAALWLGYSALRFMRSCHPLEHETQVS